MHGKLGVRSIFQVFRAKLGVRSIFQVFRARRANQGFRHDTPNARTAYLIAIVTVMKFAREAGIVTGAPRDGF